NPTPFIFEKSGNYYHHFLIDEFQDTSDTQWKNLLPLIENSLSEEGTSMVVGDVKQSIYRWRNSNWRLLGMEVSRDLQNFGISVVPLTRNFRSRQVLIDFNNLIFSKLPGVISDNLELGNYSDWMIQAYKEAVQSSGTQKKGGYVQLKSYEEDQLPKLIEELQLEQGYQPADILFLVRKNKESRIISEAFAAYLNHNPAKKNVSYQLASADTYELGSSPAVRMVILAVNLLAAPGESYYYTLLHWQWCLWKHPEKNPAPGESFELADELIHSSGEIVTRDLTGIVAYIISLLGIDSDARFQSHLFFLYDQVRILQERGTGQIHDLIYWWDTRGQHMTVPMEITPGAIQMMTIHKAKGLQFPVVIIPFLNWDVGSAPKDHFIWVDTRSSPFNMISKVPLRFKQLLGETIFHDAYLREKIELAIDQLNLLYVACTRAQEALYLFTPNPEERRKHNISKYLFETLRNELGDKDEYRFGQPSRTSDEVHADPVKEIVVNRFYLPHEKRLPSLPKQPDTPEIETGLLVHKLLSELEHPRDIDRELEKLAAVEGLSMATYKWITQRIRKVFDNDIVNDWFTGEWEVFTERSILLPGGDIRRPDRVMVHGTKAVVVDYKTGQPELKHNKQLKDYMTAISGMGYEDVKGYLLYLHEIKLVEVI
ncbi:MAG: UvrD-helicase domain-containing protein, partial [Bacteroidales bacterium]|nr:UvrD-helicase domain-containing protein [Bacteroidales bacterium]